MTRSKALTSAKNGRNMNASLEVKGFQTLTQSTHGCLQSLCKYQQVQEVKEMEPRPQMIADGNLWRPYRVIPAIHTLIKSQIGERTSLHSPCEHNRFRTRACAPGARTCVACLLPSPVQNQRYDKRFET